MIKTHKDLCIALCDAIHEKPLEFIQTESRKSGTKLNLISRALGRYHAAEDASKKFCRKVGLSIEENR